MSAVATVPTTQAAVAAATVRRADDGVEAFSRVRYGSNYANAFWDGLDDGRPLTELDLSVHEMTHGARSATANLAYSGESGGLNEATGDVMGTAVEFFANSPDDVPDHRIGELAEGSGQQSINGVDYDSPTTVRPAPVWACAAPPTPAHRSVDRRGHRG
ncbi:M4 family metallopeptidase [Streptomyces sp. NPDC088253]|uniref:M4 family metallopeptidase n=1 Tax=Streptomyces sp. NPDC088253 TaxID=3365846 RepID=UPI003818FBEF